MSKRFILIFLSLIFIIPFINAETWKYNYLDEEQATSISKTYYPITYSIVTGTLSYGNITNLSYYDNKLFVVTEGAGTGIDFRVNFTGVIDIDYLLMREQYVGGGNSIMIQIWDYDSSTWEDYGSINSQGSQTPTITPIGDSEEHIENGIVQLRFLQDAGGNPSYHLDFDYIQLLSGTTAITSNEHDSLSGRGNILTNHPQITDVFYTESEIDAFNFVDDSEVNTTQFISGDDISIKESWLITFFNWLFGTKTTDDLTEGVEKYDSSFEVIVMPDTQFYSQDYPELLTQQVQWILNHSQDNKVVMVLGNGDVADDQVEAQYIIANNSLSPLIDSNIPYLIGRGNHDEGGSYYETYFPASRFDIDGNLGEMNNSYKRLEINEENYTFFNLNNDPTLAEINWLKGIMDTYPDDYVFIATHDCLETTGSLTTTGQYIWGNLSSYDNILAFFCGHNHAEARTTQLSDTGKIVNFLLADYQSWDNGGEGYLRQYTINPDTRSIRARSYSTNLSYYNRSEESDFVVGIQETGSSEIIISNITNSSTPITWTCGESSTLDDGAFEWSCGGNGEEGQYIYIEKNIRLTSMGLSCTTYTGSAFVQIYKYGGTIIPCNVSAGAIPNAVDFCDAEVTAGSWIRPYTLTDTGHSACVLTINAEYDIQTSGGGSNILSLSNEDAYVKIGCNAGVYVTGDDCCNVYEADCQDVTSGWGGSNDYASWTCQSEMSNYYEVGCYR